MLSGRWLQRRPAVRLYGAEPRELDGRDPVRPARDGDPQVLAAKTLNLPPNTERVVRVSFQPYVAMETAVETALTRTCRP